MHATFYCYAIIVYYSYEIGASDHVKNMAIPDFTKIFDDILSNGDSSVQAKRFLRSFISMSSQSTSPNVVYYETDFSPNLQTKLEKVTDVSMNLEKKSGSPIRILLTIRLTTRSKDDVSHLYPQILDYLGNKISRFESILIDLGQDINCKRDVVESTHQHLTNIKEVKRLWSANHPSESKSIFKIGYSLEHEHYKCKFHDSSIQQADYLIVNTRLQLRDKDFVESYGIFKDQLQKHVLSFAKRVKLSFGPTFAKPVYCKFDIVAIKNGFNFPLRIEDQQQSNSNSESMKKYDNLLSNYLIQWTIEKENMGIEQQIITNYPHKYTQKNNIFDMEWLYSAKMIPYLKNIPIKGFKDVSSNHAVKYSKSSSIMLEDVASSGFDTIMIDGRKWEDLWIRRNDFSYCESSGCRPRYAIYMMDKKMPFNSSVKFLQENQSILGMKMKAFVFSHEFEKFHVENIYRALINLNVNKGINSSLLYLSWTGNLSSNEGMCPEISCKVPAINYMKDGLAWSITIDINEGEEHFVVNNLNWLDDCLVKSREAFLVEYARKSVFLVVKVRVNFTKSSLNEFSTLYCNSVGEKINQLYEAIFTWAAVRDFTVAIQPVKGSHGYANPMAWRKPNAVPNLLQRGPVFVRRSYNQTKVFGSWTKGMLPCIHMTTDNTISKSFDVSHSFVGITLNLDLRETPLLRLEEVETLLLFSLSKFQSLDIIVKKGYQCILSEAIYSPEFINNFVDNNIKCKTIYIQLEHSYNEDEDCLKRIINKLLKLGCNVCVLKTFVEGYALPWKEELAANVQLGLVHRNCIHLAYEIVMNASMQYLNNLRHLICDIDSVPAVNNNKTAMEQYLDTHLYLTKLIQYAYPNLTKVHFRLKSTMKGENLERKVKNLLRFLADVSHYAVSHQINYFIIPAFSRESRSNEDASFWTISNYNNLLNISVFNDVQAIFLNEKPEILTFRKTDRFYTSINSTFLDPITPSSSKKAQSTTKRNANNNTQNASNIFVRPSQPSEVYERESNQFGETNTGEEEFAKVGNFQIEYIATGLVAIVVVAIVSLTTVYIMLKRSGQYLSASELKDFLRGRQEILLEATTQLTCDINKQITNIFDGLMYQKQYELPKTVISIDYSNIFFKGKFSTLYRSQIEIKGIQMDVLVKVPKAACSKDIFKGFLSEVKLLCYIGEHPNIINFIGCYTTDLRKGVLWIVTECCHGGSLLDYLKINKASKTRTCSVQDLARFCLEIARGMEHAFNQNVIHGGLSARRILLTQNLTCKISGFSLERRLPEYLRFTSNNEYEMLPWQWMAPETLRKLEFSKQSDIWSFGVTMWEIFSLGDTPYPWRVEWSPGFIDDLEKGMRMTIPTLATSTIFEVMRNCWNTTPGKRANFCTLVECLHECISTDQPN